MKRWATALAVLLGMAGAGAAVAPAASAASTTCLVVDTSSNHSYATLQAAVNAAAAGGTLFVTGTCTGTTEIGKNLTVTGQNNGGTETATLDGGQEPALTIDAGIAVTLNTMVITNGGNGQIGGGIYDPGDAVILNGSTVTGNTGGSLGIGAGIVNATLFPGGNVRSGGTVTLNNSSITGNTFWSWVQAA